MELLRGLAGGLKVGRLRGQFLLRGVQLHCQIGYLGLQRLYLPCDDLYHCPLALVLTVACEDILLLRDQVAYRDQILGRIRPKGLFLGVFCFLVCDPADGVTLVVKLLLLVFECGKLLPDADDLQQRVRFFAVTHLHKPRQIERELFNKGIEQLLPGLVA